MNDKKPKVCRILSDHLDADLTEEIRPPTQQMIEAPERITQPMQQMIDRILQVQSALVDLGEEESRMISAQDLDHMRAAIQSLVHASRHLGAVAWGVDVTEWTIQTDHLFR